MATVPTYREDFSLPLHRAEAWLINGRWEVLCALCGPIFDHSRQCDGFPLAPGNPDEPPVEGRRPCTDPAQHASRWAVKHMQING